MSKRLSLAGSQVSAVAGSGNFFVDLGLPDADERLAKAELARIVRRIVKERGWTQRRAAEVLGISGS